VGISSSDGDAIANVQIGPIDYLPRGTVAKELHVAADKFATPGAVPLNSTLNPGGSYAASTTTTQNVDFYGNVTSQQISDYSGSPTGSRQYNMYFTAQMSNYPAYYIFNRLTSASVSQNYGTFYIVDLHTAAAWTGVTGVLSLVSTPELARLQRQLRKSIGSSDADYREAVEKHACGY